MVKFFNHSSSLSGALIFQFLFIISNGSLLLGSAFVILGLKMSNGLFGLSLEFSLVLSMLVNTFNNLCNKVGVEFTADSFSLSLKINLKLGKGVDVNWGKTTIAENITKKA